ncbi:MAG TPA: hypothetical protein VHZ56_08550 [Devosia sp.]|jgi:hypothetical protein|nr:hypothetical protein [Devosia sp.]
MTRIAIVAALIAFGCLPASPALANRPDGQTTLPMDSPLLDRMCGNYLHNCVWCSNATGNCYQVTGCDGTHCTIKIMFPNVVSKPKGNGRTANAPMPG